MWVHDSCGFSENQACPICRACSMTALTLSPGLCCLTCACLYPYTRILGRWGQSLGQEQDICSRLLAGCNGLHPQALIPAAHLSYGAVQGLLSYGC